MVYGICCAAGAEKGVFVAKHASRVCCEGLGYGGWYAVVRAGVGVGVLLKGVGALRGAVKWTRGGAALCVGLGERVMFMAWGWVGCAREGVFGLIVKGL